MRSAKASHSRNDSRGGSLYERNKCTKKAAAPLPVGRYFLMKRCCSGSAGKPILRIGRRAQKGNLVLPSWAVSGPCKPEVRQPEQSSFRTGSSQGKVTNVQVMLPQACAEDQPEVSAGIVTTPPAQLDLAAPRSHAEASSPWQMPHHKYGVSTSATLVSSQGAVGGGAFQGDFTPKGWNCGCIHNASPILPKSYPCLGRPH